MSNPCTFPFGQPVKTLKQLDCAQKDFFVLGVYASAVHARWIGKNGETRVNALAIASEPCIFWRGNDAEKIISQIAIPSGLGYLKPAQAKLNGPSGQALDKYFLEPLGISRADTWLCDLVPHSCMNPNQKKAIEREYEPLMQTYGLPEVTLPEVPVPLIDDARRLEILDEIKTSKSKTIILLGDQPIKWFLRYHDDRWKKLSDFRDYGKICEAEIDGRLYKILPLVHPRQAAKLGAHSGKWADLHQKWIKK